MIQYLIPARARLHAFFAAARSTVCLSRILLVLITLETLTMPFTQGLWSWDRFLHGGQDFELGLLIIVTCLCFVLLRVQQQDRSGKLFAIVRALFQSGRRQPPAVTLLYARSFTYRPQIPSTLEQAAFNVPLLI